MRASRKQPSTKKVIKSNNRNIATVQKQQPQQKSNEINEEEIDQLRKNMMESQQLSTLSLRKLIMVQKNARQYEKKCVEDHNFTDAQKANDLCALIDSEISRQAGGIRKQQIKQRKSAPIRLSSDPAVRDTQIECRRREVDLKIQHSIEIKRFEDYWANSRASTYAKESKELAETREEEVYARDRGILSMDEDSSQRIENKTQEINDEEQTQDAYMKAYSNAKKRLLTRQQNEMRVLQRKDTKRVSIIQQRPPNMDTSWSLEQHFRLDHYFAITGPIRKSRPPPSSRSLTQITSKRLAKPSERTPAAGYKFISQNNNNKENQDFEEQIHFGLEDNNPRFSVIGSQTSDASFNSFEEEKHFTSEQENCDLQQEEHPQTEEEEKGEIEKVFEKILGDMSSEECNPGQDGQLPNDSDITSEEKLPEVKDEFEDRETSEEAKLSNSLSQQLSQETFTHEEGNESKMSSSSSSSDFEKKSSDSSENDRPKGEEQASDFEQENKAVSNIEKEQKSDSDDFEKEAVIAQKEETQSDSSSDFEKENQADNDLEQANKADNGFEKENKQEAIIAQKEETQSDSSSDFEQEKEQEEKKSSDSSENDRPKGEEQASDFEQENKAVSNIEKEQKSDSDDFEKEAVIAQKEETQSDSSSDFEKENEAVELDKREDSSENDKPKEESSEQEKQSNSSIDFEKAEDQEAPVVQKEETQSEDADDFEKENEAASGRDKEQKSEDAVDFEKENEFEGKGETLLASVIGQLVDEGEEEDFVNEETPSPTNRAIEGETEEEHVSNGENSDFENHAMSNEKLETEGKGETLLASVLGQLMNDKEAPVGERGIDLETEQTENNKANAEETEENEQDGELASKETNIEETEAPMLNEGEPRESDSVQDRALDINEVSIEEALENEQDSELASKETNVDKSMLNESESRESDSVQDNEVENNNANVGETEENEQDSELENQETNIRETEAAMLNESEPKENDSVQDRALENQEEDIEEASNHNENEQDSELESKETNIRETEAAMLNESEPRENNSIQDRALENQEEDIKQALENENSTLNEQVEESEIEQDSIGKEDMSHEETERTGGQLLTSILGQLIDEPPKGDEIQERSVIDYESQDNQSSEQKTDSAIEQEVAIEAESKESENILSLDQNAENQQEDISAMEASIDEEQNITPKEDISQERKVELESIESNDHHEEDALSGSEETRQNDENMQNAEEKQEIASVNQTISTLGKLMEDGPNSEEKKEFNTQSTELGPMASILDKLID